MKIPVNATEVFLTPPKTIPEGQTLIAVIFHAFGASDPIPIAESDIGSFALDARQKLFFLVKKGGAK